MQADGQQLLTQDFAAAGVVVDHQDGVSGQVVRYVILTQGFVHHVLQVDAKTESAAVPQLAADTDVATHHLHQTAADRQAQAGAAEAAHGAGVGLGEHVEDDGLFVR